jgi:hypothetical protein
VKDGKEVGDMRVRFNATCEANSAQGKCQTRSAWQALRDGHEEQQSMVCAQGSLLREITRSKGGGYGRGVLSHRQGRRLFPARYGIVAQCQEDLEDQIPGGRGRRVNVGMSWRALGALLRGTEGNWKTDPRGCQQGEPVRVGGESQGRPGLVYVHLDIARIPGGCTRGAR